ncbi:membrane protein [Lentzea sp. NBRC 102530]|nr:membrane protein [Lentzea sp. NBRC 102530]
MQTLTGSFTRMRGPLSVLAAGAAGATLLLFVDPNQPGNLLPKCPFNWLTGLNCPACGVTRMLHALLHGDVVSAFHFNAVMLAFGVPLVLWLFVRWSRDRWTGERRSVPRSVGVAVLVVAVVWGVGRNLAGV